MASLQTDEVTQEDFASPTHLKAPVNWDVPKVQTPPTQGSPTTFNTVSLDSKMNTPYRSAGSLSMPATARSPSLMRAASTRITVALDKTKVFPPEPVHEEHTPHCTFRACIISSWLVITALVICFIVLALHMSEQDNEIDALSQELSTSASTVDDPCSEWNGNCEGCLSSTGGYFNSGCYWAYFLSLGLTVREAGIECKSNLPNGRPFNIPTRALTTTDSGHCSYLQTNPETKAVCQDAAAGDASQNLLPAKCSGQPGFVNPTTGCPNNTPYCCPKYADCMKLPGAVCEGTCVADPSYCGRSSTGECVPNNIGR